MGLKSLKRSIRDVIINLIERVFIENIFVSFSLFYCGCKKLNLYISKKILPNIIRQLM